MSGSAQASRLDFLSSAASTFDFLLHDPYRLTLSARSGLRVEYLSEFFFVFVFQDRLSYELDVQVGRLGKREEAQRPYTLGDILRVHDLQAGDSYRRFAATTEVAVKNGLQHLANDLRRYGHAALLGSQDFYDLLAETRAATVQTFGEKERNRVSRLRANLAWTNSDYRAAVSAYEALTDPLPSELLRLKIARQRITNE